MSAALKTVENMGPDAMAFISGGTPKPQFVQPAALPIQAQEARAVVEPASQPNDEIPKRSKGKTLNPEQAIAPSVPGTVSFNTRLPAEIHQALLTASFNRKMMRKEPWTQQEITIEALAAWLKKEGFF